MKSLEDEDWLRALLDLQKVVPGARSFLPDEIARAAKVCGKPLIWRRIPGFESEADSDIWQDIKPSDLESPDSPITVIADACFSHDIGPLKSSWAKLDALVDAFVDLYSDEMFGGDVIMISPTRLLVVHHEGLVADVSKPPQEGPEGASH